MNVKVIKLFSISNLLIKIKIEISQLVTNTGFGQGEGYVLVLESGEYGIPVNSQFSYLGNDTKFQAASKMWLQIFYRTFWREPLFKWQGKIKTIMQFIGVCTSNSKWSLSKLDDWSTLSGHHFGQGWTKELLIFYLCYETREFSREYVRVLDGGLHFFHFFTYRISPLPHTHTP